MSTHRIEIEVDVPVTEQILDSLRRAVDSTLRHEPVGSAEVTLLLTSSERVRHLNDQYRGIDKVTDVLSFPLGETLPDGGHYLGDVAVAVPVARERAAAAGHTLVAELTLLAIHGTLHLLGYDHATSVDRVRMWSRQSQLLAEMGLEASPTED